jgi:hypothetical protein
VTERPSGGLTPLSVLPTVPVRPLTALPTVAPARVTVEPIAPVSPPEPEPGPEPFPGGFDGDRPPRLEPECRRAPPLERLRPVAAGATPEPVAPREPAPASAPAVAAAARAAAFFTRRTLGARLARTGGSWTTAGGSAAEPSCGQPWKLTSALASTNRIAAPASSEPAVPNPARYARVARTLSVPSATWRKNFSPRQFNSHGRLRLELYKS